MTTAQLGSSTTPTVVTTGPTAVHDFSKPLIISTKSVFSMMLGWQVESGEPTTNRTCRSTHDVSGLISLSGPTKIGIVVSLSQEVAFEAAKAFLGTKPKEIDSDVLDMVGELANMIGGSAKDSLGLSGLQLGLPTVVAGSGHVVAFEPSAKVTSLPFSTAHGPLTIQVCTK